ncbi:d-isomer specific 2-hydroxyacid dehydrogenase, nad-binding domain [Heliomicrobium modesticaldum Ice1]|uniref:D-isomer specific 2-hydroxyacid dehydrogenase, nad-binding domain n=1 Tax=Heliobacterium modesticaldum (strain ATCC 51547 / Ice1) TaxID=498761 RepID=B0TCD4_HELMI|nr:D-2-hydroxyacid dehydrogenase [Heliomicrobium modesticaldum]ABZ85322.1 d-isomer specific 2-hydroxyacid dehydrogenase, nad-binding domain [Heliomicrobium modesticaldum Ice1]
MKILTTMPFPEWHRERLERTYPGILWRICRSTGEALEFLPGADILVTYGDGLTAEVLRRASKLRWIQSFAGGLEHIPFDVLREREITLTSAKGVHAVQAAEHTLGVMLAFVRQLPFFVRMQEQARWEDHVKLDEIHQKTVCIVGLGAMGMEIAHRALAFGMRVTGVNSDGRTVAEVHKTYPRDQIDLAIAEADFVVLAMPLTAASERRFGTREFSLMKRSAFLINIARGKVIDEPALVRALQEGQIAGAALDVFVEEPLPAESPLWKMPNVIITPHVAGRSPRYLDRALEIFETNLEAFLAEKPLPLNVVDLEKGY